jgi:hypothetical protein
VQGELSEQEEEEPADELTQSELDQLTGSLSDEAISLSRHFPSCNAACVLDANRQFDWAQAQDMQIMSINGNSAFDDCIAEVHWKCSNPTILKKHPLSQAKELFPQATAWHMVMTSGGKEDDPN